MIVFCLFDCFSRSQLTCNPGQEHVGPETFYVGGFDPSLVEFSHIRVLTSAQYNPYSKHCKKKKVGSWHLHGLSLL